MANRDLSGSPQVNPRANPPAIKNRAKFAKVYRVDSVGDIIKRADTLDGNPSSRSK